ncbi:MAG: dihydropteroate synthase [Sulfuricellaceae bacterium]|nr:dihydropteroate synthase [Sulfuricellaceae bacterium]
MLRCGRFNLSLDRPLIMGIINVTPDSFSDGGRFFSPASALAHARRLIDEGADLLDIGGESTRPGAAAVPEPEELERVIPVLDALSGLNVPLSVDTRKPAVMRAALAAGADMINDVNAFRSADALEVVASSEAALCMMHMQGEPRTMQAQPKYSDVAAEVTAFLAERAAAAVAAGISRERLMIDPGFGFGKTLQDNLALLRNLPQLAASGLPVLAGLSRKSMLGEITGRGVTERGAASLAAMLMALEYGAKMIRVHDVADARDALKVWQAIRVISHC